MGRYLVSMPFLNSGGPVGGPDARVALAMAAAEEARRGSADLLELRTRHACPALQQTDRKLTVCLELPATSEELWQRFPSKLRSQVKRPKNAGYVTRFGLGERDAFYDVYARHMRDLGSPALGKRVFDVAAREFSRSVEFGVVYDPSGHPAAAGCGLVGRNEF